MMTLPPDSQLIESFHLMYDHFPETVMLIHKSREILAVNKAAALSGVAVGTFCNQQGKPENHQGCLGNKALQAHSATWMAYPAPNRPGDTAIAFWLPVDGYPDIFVHFGVGNSRDYDTPPSFV